MTTDSLAPVLYRVSINGVSLGGIAPADGFIDPVSIQRYRLQIEKTGTILAPVVNNNDDIIINGVGITFETGSLDLTGIISTINALTDRHHVIASNSAGNLKITNDIHFEGDRLHITEGNVGGVLAAIGFVSPVVVKLNANVSSLLKSFEKERGNMRFNRLIKSLSQIASLRILGSYNMPGANIETTASSIDFTVGFYLDSHIRIEDELNPGVILKNTAAIKRAVARALVVDVIQNRAIINPAGNISNRIETITAAKLAPNLITAETEITVTPISNLG